MAEENAKAPVRTYAGEQTQAVALPALASEDEARLATGVASLGVRFGPDGLVPAVIQQVDDTGAPGEVLMVAWMNLQALVLTLRTKTSWFWSRSRGELWNKGATSGNMQQLRELRADCDGDTLLALVDSPGPACHTGNRSCFYRSLTGESDG